MYSSLRAHELLTLGTRQPDAQFREDQEVAIRHVVEGTRRLLVVQKTGWGKSFVYFIATKLLREAGMGPAILISPLLALMRNQLAAAERMGLRAATINSDNQTQWQEIEQEVKEDRIDILLISPERLANERFREEVLSRIGASVPLLVIDEAHCISDWGHDFRPHYRLVQRILAALPPNLRVMATTATANDRVLDDLCDVLGPDLRVLRGDLHRPSLALQTIRLPSQAERLAWLAQQLSDIPGHGIIYTLTVRDAERVAGWLQSQGHNVSAYTGRSGELRPQLEEALLNNELKALVATTALGMGFDKPDLAFVFHYQVPGSVVHYYQQVGRAGRALTAARGVLLSGEEDASITNYFIENAFPRQHQVIELLAALETEPGGLTLRELASVVNLRWGHIEKVLATLSLESPSPIIRVGPKWQLTAQELSPQFWERAERLTALRRFEQEQMQDYVNLKSGHMQFLISALDGAMEDVGEPPLLPLAADVEPRLVEEAIAFLRSSSLAIEPRKRWPSSGLRQLNATGRIAENLRAREGRALCKWGDAGWGELVRRAKSLGATFDDNLVEASANLVRQWKPAEAPTWVTCIPSHRSLSLVPDFASRLAAALELPFYPVLKCALERPQQKTMSNSEFQARNADGAFQVDGQVPTGPVLLIDDIVDSRWTMTVAAALLRKSGSGNVFPLALADAQNGAE